MGLLTIIRKQKIRERSLRILMLGLDNAGKTTILKCLLGEPTDQISPTLGFNIKSLEFAGFRLDIWDVGGQKTIRSYWRNYFESTDGLVWVVDSSDRIRMGDCKNELSALLQEERLLGADLLVLANKSDVEGCMTAADIEHDLGLNDIKGHHWKIFEVSAVTGSMLTNAFDWMCEDLKATKYRAIDL